MLARISEVSPNRIFNVSELVGLKIEPMIRYLRISYGMKQRLGIAQVLLHDPSVVVLDEPNNGLDPNGIADMAKLMVQMHLVRPSF